MRKSNTSNHNSPGMQLSLRPHSSRQPQSVSFRAPGRKGHALASPRDRDRLREKNRAERVRVEKMFETPTTIDDRRVQRRDSRDRNEARALSPLAPVSPFRGPIGLANRPFEHCPVCGDDRIVSDEVFHVHGGTLSMSECLHCDHRWTRRPNTRWVGLGTRMNRGGVRPGTVTA